MLLDPKVPQSSQSSEVLKVWLMGLPSPDSLRSAASGLHPDPQSQGRWDTISREILCTVLSCWLDPALHSPARDPFYPCRNSFTVWVLPLPPPSALSSSKYLNLFAVFLSLNENLLYLSPHSAGLVLTFSLVQNTPASSIP